MNLNVGDMIQSNANKAVGIIIRINDRYKGTTWITINWIETNKQEAYTATYPFDYVFGSTFIKVS